VAITILHLDGSLLAVDKPPGRLVIPGRKVGERTLQQELEEAHGRLWVVHRLDRGTSGVLLFARTAAAHRAVNLAFDRREVDKRYLALVRGDLPDTLRVEVPLAPARRGRMRPGRPGEAGVRPAATRFHVLERFRRAEVTALVEAAPETGRTHQIRVHLAQAGAPLCLDPDYGPREFPAGADGAPLLGRTPLHAASLELVHPRSGERLRLTAPLPGDLTRLLAWARAG